MRTRNDDGLGWVGAVSALEGPGGACLLPDGKYAFWVAGGRQRGSDASGFVGRSPVRYWIPLCSGVTGGFGGMDLLRLASARGW